MTASELPPNIRDFNEITGVLFGRLYASFPNPKVIPPEAITQALGLEGTQSPMSSGQPFNAVLVHTIDWLNREEFIRDAVPPMGKFVLTTKGMAAMNAVPPSLSRPLGSELAEATEQASTEAGKRKISELIGELFGSALGSFTKNISGA
jgi:hypothetical protein